MEAPLTYLYPIVLRVGLPVIQYVVDISSDDGGDYFLLCTAYNLSCIEKYTGLATDYDSFSKVRISKKLYCAFVNESKQNEKRYNIGE